LGYVVVPNAFFYDTNFIFSSVKILDFLILQKFLAVILLKKIKMLNRIKVLVMTVGTLALNCPICPVQANEITEVVCPVKSSSPRRSFETAKYQAYICLGDSKNSQGYYVRITKSDGVKITVPLTRKNGENYLAMRGEVGYLISPYELIVMKQGHTVLRERVYRAIAADGKPISQACPDGETLLNEALTRSFIVYICGNNSPLNYIAIARGSNRRIIVPLSNSKSQAENKYVAVQGDTSYVLTRNVLRVSQNGQIVVKEKVLRWN
jgi:hypothetical protein